VQCNALSENIIMARRARPAGSDLISTITGTIASHPRLSAAVAFQMGVLLGQVMHYRGATFSALKRGVGAAPEAITSALPSFGLFGDNAQERRGPAPRRAARKTRAPRKRRAAR
jgi:hypothetical protein